MSDAIDPPAVAATFAVVLAVLALSGCTTPAQPTEELASNREGPPVTTTGPPQTEAPAEWEQGAFGFAGSTGAGVCAPTGPGSCMGATTPAEAHATLGPGGGASWRIRANLTWDAASPTTEELHVSLGPFRFCGPDCMEAVGAGHRVFGASPLAIMADLEAPEEADGVWILVAQRPEATPAGLLGVYTPQDFALEGMTWHRPS